MNATIRAAMAIGLVLVTKAPAAAQDRAALEQTLIANERVVNSAIAEGNLAVFKEHVAEDGFAIDVSGRLPTAERIRTFENFRKLLQVKEWDASDFQVQWVSADVAVVSYKWTGTGTFGGEPLPSPVWSSTVWARRDGRWVAVFHQETAVVPVPE